jgi:succinate-acetate transporter protein
MSRTFTDSRTIAFFMVFMGVLCFVYLICSLRTNICFFVIFLTLVIAFGLLAGVYFNTSLGNAALANRLLVGAGASLFVTCLSGWWIFFAIILASVDFPFQLPVGDLSTMIKGGSTRMKEKESMA